MEKEDDEMREEIEEVEKNDKVVKIIENVREEKVKEDKEIEEMMVEKVKGKVRWRENIEWFYENGVKKIYEVG